MASRKKTYYTIDETTNNLFTIGKQWMTLNKKEYKGAYHTYLTGEVFTGATWNPKTAKILVEYESPITNPNIRIYKKLKPKVKTAYKSVKSSTPIITNINTKTGKITRYFYKQYDNETIFETTRSVYQEIERNRVDKKLYIFHKIQWHITGPKQDEYKNGVFIPGVVTKNTNQIKFVSKTMPGIKNILTDPLQYYTDSDFIAPTDINGLDS
jgi:hypothetical protein